MEEERWTTENPRLEGTGTRAEEHSVKPGRDLSHLWKLEPQSASHEWRLELAHTIVTLAQSADICDIILQSTTSKSQFLS